MEFMQFFDGNNYYSKNGLNKQEEQVLRMDLFYLHTNGKGPCSDKVADLLLKEYQWNLKHALEHYFVMLPQIKMRCSEELRRNMLELYKVKMVAPIASMLMELGKWNVKTAASLYFKYVERITEVLKRGTGGKKVDAEMLKELEIFIMKEQEKGRKRKRKKNNKKKKRRKYKKHKKKNSTTHSSKDNKNKNITAILPAELSQCQIFISAAEISKLKAIYNPKSDDTHTPPKPTPNIPTPILKPTSDDKLTQRTPLNAPSVKQSQSSNTKLDADMRESSSNNNSNIPSNIPLNKPPLNKSSPPSELKPRVVVVVNTLKPTPDNKQPSNPPSDNEPTSNTSLNAPPSVTPPSDTPISNTPISPIPSDATQSTSNNKIPSDTPNQPSKPTPNNNVTSDEAATTISTSDQPSNPTSHTNKSPYIHLKMPMLKYKYLEKISWQRELELSNEWEWVWEYDPPLDAPYQPSSETSSNKLLDPPSNTLNTSSCDDANSPTHNHSSVPTSDYDETLNTLQIPSNNDASLTSTPTHIIPTTLQPPSNVPDPPANIPDPLVNTSQLPLNKVDPLLNTLNMPLNKSDPSSNPPSNKLKLLSNVSNTTDPPLNELDPLLNKLKPTSDYDATQNTLHMPSNTPDPPSKPIPNNINMPPKPIPNNGNASDILHSSFKPTPNIQTTIETTKIPSKPMNKFGLSGGSMNKNKTDASPIMHTYCDKNKNKSDTFNPPSPSNKSNPPSPSNKLNLPSFTFIQSSKQTPNNDVTLNKLNTPSNPSLKPTLTPTLKPISKYDTTINALQPPTNTPDPPSNKLKPTSNKDATLNLMSNPISTLTLNPTLMSLTSSKPILNNESAPSKPIPNNGNAPAKLISNNDNASDILSLSFKPTANIKTTFETANGPSKPNLNNANVPSNTLNALKPTSEYDETLNILQLPSNTPDPPSSTVKPTSDYAATPNTSQPSSETLEPPSNTPDPPPNTSPHYIKSLYTPLPPSKPPERSKKVVKNDSDPRERDKYKMDIKGKCGSGGNNMDPRERDKSRIMGRYGTGDGNMDPRERDKDKLRDAYDDGNEPRDRDKFSGYNNYLLDNINDMIFRLSLNNWYLSAVGNPPYVTAALATLTLNMLYQVRDYVVCIVWLFMWNTRLYSVIILLLTAVGYHNYYVTAALTTKTLNLLNKMETEVDFGITYIFSKQITSGRDGLDKGS